MTPLLPIFSSVVIGLGSNINPEQNLRAAAGLLRAHWPLIRFSPVFLSAAREIESQDDFLNAVAVIETDDTPEKVAEYLQEIERTLKKSPPYRFGPRTIDLDLLLYGAHVTRSPSLRIPHPRMHQRRFVLEPLCELIIPQELHPILRESWQELLQKTMDQDCEKAALEL